MDSRRPKFRLGLGPLLVLFVATTQWVLAAVTEISPWIGGGYGMFAVVDGSNRKILLANDGSIAALDNPAARQAPFPWTLEHIKDEEQADRVFVVRPVFDSTTGEIRWDEIASTSAGT